MSTIWEFWNRVQPFIQRLFDRLVQLLDDGTLPIGMYNPRNTAEPLVITFRVEALAEEQDVHLDRDALV